MCKHFLSSSLGVFLDILTLQNNTISIKENDNDNIFSELSKDGIQIMDWKRETQSQDTKLNGKR